MKSASLPLYTDLCDTSSFDLEKVGWKISTASMPRSAVYIITVI